MAHLDKHIDIFIVNVIKRTSDFT